MGEARAAKGREVEGRDEKRSFAKERGSRREFERLQITRRVRESARRRGLPSDNRGKSEAEPRPRRQETRGATCFMTSVHHVAPAS